MRGQRTAWTAIAVTMGTGLWSTTHGVVTGTTITYRAGMAALLVGHTGLVMMCVHLGTLRLMAHANNLAQTSVETRQQYAEMGWRAAMAAASRPGGGAGPDAQVICLPTQQHQIWHHEANR